MFLCTEIKGQILTVTPQGQNTRNNWPRLNYTDYAILLCKGHNSIFNCLPQPNSADIAHNLKNLNLIQKSILFSMSSQSTTYTTILFTAETASVNYYHKICYQRNITSVPYT
jgi:hypothetical protein